MASQNANTAPNGQPPGSRHAFRGWVELVTTVLGLASGITGMAGFSAGVARNLLYVLCIGLLLVGLVHFWYRFFVAKTTARSQEYVETLVRALDREATLFSDKLVIKVFIGKTDSDDRIVEEWDTVPDPQMTQRAYCPIIPTDDDKVVRMADLGFTAHLDREAGSITALPLVERARYLRVWLVFEPAWRTPVKWVTEYRPAGLWRRLRETGSDRLGWHDRLPSLNGHSSSLREIEVIFVFPPGPTPRVTERQGLGTISPARKNVDNAWQIQWHDPSPSNRHYTWDLTQPPA